MSILVNIKSKSCYIICILLLILFIQNSLTEDDSYILKSAALAASNESLFWGTYRPNLYFGTRPRLPESLLTGLIWFGIEDLSSFNSIL